MGMVVARKPVILGIRRRTGCRHQEEHEHYQPGVLCECRRTVHEELAIQALAPLLLRACASDSDEASTKKLDQPKLRSKSLQLSTPIPGVSRHTHATRAGMAGCQ